MHDPKNILSTSRFVATNTKNLGFTFDAIFDQPVVGFFFFFVVVVVVVVMLDFFIYCVCVYIYIYILGAKPTTRDLDDKFPKYNVLLKFTPSK